MKKIMFNDKYGLTEAVIEGRKTMTRRIIPQLMSDKDFDISEWGINDQGKVYICLYEGGRQTTDIFPAYQPDEVVAVAQSYKSVFEESLNYALPRYHWLDDHIDEKGFENKMFVKASEMPHQIQITDVKIERLQDISDEDIIKEGVKKGMYLEPENVLYYFDEFCGFFRDGQVRIKGYSYKTEREAIAELIDKVCGKGTWEQNPYVFAYTFELVK